MTPARSRSGESGFSLVELAVVCIIVAIICAIALTQMIPALQSSRSDNAMRIVLDQLRQAREYSITNRRYVQVTFPVVGGQSEIVLTQMNVSPWAKNAGTTNTVLSTVYIPSPLQYAVVSGMPDTPDKYGNSSATSFVIEGTSTAAAGPMFFQSDGELIDSATLSTADGTVFLGVPGNPSSARAVTVMGATGRVRGWRSSGKVGSTPTLSWFQF
jgi:Tfp pilus assembly protein FimT